MKKNQLRFLCVLVLGVSVFSGCGRKEYVLDGFAFFEQTKPGTLFEAMSPDGVKIQGREEANYPEATQADFWAKAVANYVPQRGYELIKEGAQKEGKYFIFLVPGSKYDYFYCVYFEVTPEKIQILEAGGRYALLEKYQQKILEFASGIFQQKEKNKG